MQELDLDTQHVVVVLAALVRAVVTAATAVELTLWRAISDAQRRTLRARFLRGSTIGHRKVESGPSWLATFSAMDSNPASVGSGGCRRRDEATFCDLRLGSRPNQRGETVAIRTDPNASPRPDRGARMPDSVDRDNRRSFFGVYI
jgi:hypothetical protein